MDAINAYPLHPDTVARFEATRPLRTAGLGTHRSALVKAAGAHADALIAGRIAPDARLAHVAGLAEASKALEALAAAADRSAGFADAVKHSKLVYRAHLRAQPPLDLDYLEYYQTVAVAPGPYDSAETAAAAHAPFSEILKAAAGHAPEATPPPAAELWVHQAAFVVAAPREPLPGRLTGNTTADDDDVEVAGGVVELVDPLTRAPFADPYRSNHCGHVYDRELLHALFAQHGTAEILCPTAGCGVSLRERDFVPDRLMRLRMAVAAWEQPVQDLGVRL